MLSVLDLIEKDSTVLAAEPTCLIQYMANKIPFFYYLLSPDLAYFKLHMWSFTLWEIKGKMNERFNIEVFRKDEHLNNQIKRLIVLCAALRVKRFGISICWTQRSIKFTIVETPNGFKIPMMRIFWSKY